MVGKYFYSNVATTNFEGKMQDCHRSAPKKEKSCYATELDSGHPQEKQIAIPMGDTRQQA